MFFTYSIISILLEMSEISFEKYKVLFKSLPKFWSINNLVNKFAYFYYILYETIKKNNDILIQNVSSDINILIYIPMSNYYPTFS